MTVVCHSVYRITYANAANIKEKSFRFLVRHWPIIYDLEMCSLGFLVVKLKKFAR